MFERLNLQAELEFKSMRTPIQSTGPPKWGFPAQFSLPVLLYLSVRIMCILIFAGLCKLYVLLLNAVLAIY